MRLVESRMVGVAALLVPLSHFGCIVELDLAMIPRTGTQPDVTRVALTSVVEPEVEIILGRIDLDTIR
jgi:hypothetical protein